MAGRHLRDLIAAYGERDDLKFRRAAQAIIQEEENKRHTVLARELKGLLTANSGFAVHEEPLLPEPPVDRDSALPLAAVVRPEVYLPDLVLAPEARAELASLVREVRNWPTLDAAGLPRRNRVLLSGPPGCGKTSAVSALANELGRTLIVARIEGLISSYLGETAANLNALFEFASTGPFVLFLDEFDSVGKTRTDSSDHGELRRVVNAVLQQIDRYRGPALIVAATNHASVLDAALWRRFDAVIEMPLPDRSDVEKLLAMQLPGSDRSMVADRLDGLPHAAITYLAQTAKRRALLEGRSNPDRSDVESALAVTLSRPWL